MSTSIDEVKVFVVIPVYNENTVISSVVKELLPYNFQLVLVDDGSVNPLYALLSNFQVTILRHNVNLGQGAALQTGINYALSQQAEYIVTFDGDGQHNAADIDKLLQPLISKKYDITIGSRFMIESNHNMPFKRKALLQIARYINFLFTGLFLTDASNGMRAMTRNTAEVIQITEAGMAHSSEILSKIKKKKLRFQEMPVTIHYSTYSMKKGLTVWSSFRILFDLLLNKIFK